jgi:hypothetical protein
MMERSAGLSMNEARREERRNQAVEALSARFAQNALSLEEYERLAAYINRTESERELGLIEKIVNDAAWYADPLVPGSLPPSAPGAKRELALLSCREVSGAMLLDRRRSFAAVLGSMTITIREGDLPPGRSILRVHAVLGTVVINVPHSLAVSMEAGACLGNAVSNSRGRRLPNAPELVIVGGAYLGNITVAVFA